MTPERVAELEARGPLRPLRPITPEWLEAHGACRDSRLLLGDRRLTLPEAAALLLDADCPEWCQWGASQLLQTLPHAVQCRLAARWARMGQHLWTEGSRDACEAAVRCAERVAAGETLAPGEAWAAWAGASQAARVASASSPASASAWAAAQAAMVAWAAWADPVARAAAAAEVAWWTWVAAAWRPRSLWLTVAADVQAALEGSEAV